MRETILCDLCGSTTFETRHHITERLLRRGEIFTVVACRSCRLVFVNPRPQEAHMGEYYPPFYIPFAKSKGVAAFVRRLAVKKEAKDLLRHFQKAPAVLEVGAGCGEDAALLQKFLGVPVVATDVSLPAVDAGKKLFKLHIRHGDLAAQRFPSGSFDYARLKYVLSHVSSPKALLFEVYRVLKPRGLITLRLPNYDSWCRRLFKGLWEGQEPPRHLFSFTPEIIQRYLTEVGFVDVEVRGSIVPNTWIHSFRNLLEERGISPVFRKLFTVNAAALALFFPIALAAALCGKSDRITVYARKT